MDLSNSLSENAMEVTNTTHSSSRKSILIFGVILLILVTLALGIYIGTLVNKQASNAVNKDQKGTNQENVSNDEDSKDTQEENNIEEDVVPEETENITYEFSGSVDHNVTVGLEFKRDMTANVENLEENNSNVGIVVSDKDYELKIFSSPDGSGIDFDHLPRYSFFPADSSLKNNRVYRIEKTDGSYFYTSTFNTESEDCTYINPTPRSCGTTWISLSDDKNVINATCNVNGDQETALEKCDKIISSLKVIVTEL